jgi:hypothetical protein
MKKYWGGGGGDTAPRSVAHGNTIEFPLSALLTNSVNVFQHAALLVRNLASLHPLPCVVWVFLQVFGIRDILLNIVIKLLAGWLGSIPGKGRNLFLFATMSGVQPVSYPVSTGGKAAEEWS